MSIAEVGLPDNLHTEWCEMPGQTSTGSSSYMKFQNGSTNPALPDTADQSWLVSCSGTTGDPNKDHFVITGQSSGPVASKEALDIAPSGQVSFPNGLTVPNSQTITLQDSNGNICGQITAGVTGTTYPDGAYMTFSVPSDTPIYFAPIGATGEPQSSIMPSSTANSDGFQCGGDMLVTGLLQTGSLQFVLDPANPIYGNQTLVNGLATVNTNQADVTSTIILTRTNVNASTFLGELRVRQKNAQSFIVEATNPSAPGSGAQTGDQSSFDWILINPSI